MKKEDLLKIACNRTTSYNEMMFAFNEFFDSNICIPKGKNRHPYADVLHEWIEGANITYFDKNTSRWNNVMPSKIVLNGLDYHIKPSEPIYEWQYTTMSCGIKLFT